MVDTKFLQSHSLFGGLSDAELDIIVSHLHEEHFPAGANIVQEGQPGDRLYFIVEGSVSILKTVPAEKGETQEEIAILRTGDSFGEMEFIDVQSCVATARAGEDVTVLTLSNRALYTIYKENMKTYAILIMNMAREISRRLRKMDALVATSLYSRNHISNAHNGRGAGI